MTPSRTYRQVRRAQRADATRRRIVRAAMELHTSLGPARTTIAAIARRAGVQRLTVYRHFPTLKLLFQACSGLARSIHPPPDPASWRAIADPERRLRRALHEQYGHYAETASLWANVLRDATTHDLVREAASHRFRMLDEARDILMPGWRSAPARRRLVRASLGHALSFRTWESLVMTQGATSEQAVELMVRLVRAAVRSGSPNPRGGP